jgi:hypothetical protein
LNIRWDETKGFIAEFSTDFNGDLAAVKNAGFKCDGPPAWTWWTAKLASLNKLRENKPISGLTINESAFQQYARLSEIEAKNAEARKAFAPVAEEQKKAKKQRKREEEKERAYTTLVIPSKPGELYDFLGAEDLPPLPPFELKNLPPPWTGPRCVYCRQPVYPYEKQEPIPTCLWCEKNLEKTS